MKCLSVTDSCQTLDIKIDRNDGSNIDVDIFIAMKLKHIYVPMCTSVYFSPIKMKINPNYFYIYFIAWIKGHNIQVFEITKDIFQN